MYSATKQTRKKKTKQETKHSVVKWRAWRHYLTGVRGVIAHFGLADLENAFNAGFDEGTKQAKR